MFNNKWADPPASFGAAMDELKLRAGEKFEALHDAAITAAGSGKSRVTDVFNQTAEAIRKIREAFNDLWHNELIAEGRSKVAAWTRDTIQRVREGAPPLSPVLLYEELLALFHDRVWRRSILIFTCGLALGGGVGLVAGLRFAGRVPSGPHARALITHPDQTVILVEDAVAPGAGAGEVLVRVQAFSVCGVDRGTLRGRGHMLRSLLSRGYITVGRGFAGVVLDVGYGVNDLELGDEVWGCVSEWSGGAASELLTIRSTRVSKRPRGLAAADAASLPWAGGAARAALRRLQYSPEVTKGRRVAICGAASGEGCILIQLLSNWGGHLTAVAPRHAALTLKDLGVHDYVDSEGSNDHVMSGWLSLEKYARLAGPWDAVLTCGGADIPPGTKPNTAALLKATAPRSAMLDLRPRPFITDRLPTPFSLMFAGSFYTFRMLRWVLGRGWHTDWLEEECGLRAGLDELTQLVESGQIVPVLDKVYIPQDFETALAHACSDDSIGTTVIRFP